jgi:hypothetical protein
LGVLNDVKAFARYAVGLRSFLRQPLTSEECRRQVERGLNTRDRALLVILERAVYGQARSPYRALLEHAGIELGDVERLLRESGVEGALERLHDEGVYVSLDEFKGRRPIQRPGLSLDVRPENFDGPLIGAAFVGSTGGSTGPRRRVFSDFDHRAHGAVYHRLFLEAFDLLERPAAVWRAAPPGSAGIGTVLGSAKVGQPVERWFSHNRLLPRRGIVKDFVFTAYTVAASRTSPMRLPWPEYVPVQEAGRVARWAAEKRGSGTPALLSAPASSGVRVALAAEKLGLDIAGTFFRLSGEPFTQAKADVIVRTGARAVSNYSMSELGRVGVACASPEALDDLHVTTDHLAVIQRERTVAPGASVPALLFTTLRPNAPKLMLNVESDDYGTLVQRECGCLLGELGFSTHVHSVRSYEKLTSEGMTFVGSDVIVLLDELLPARFGGQPTDYQLVEEEVDGFPKVGVVVSPTVGEVDERAVIEAVLGALSAGPGYKGMMADVWRGGDTLRVVRREPYATAAGKILPLHVLDRVESGS